MKSFTARALALVFGLAFGAQIDAGKNGGVYEFGAVAGARYGA